MSARINTQIPRSKFELVRDQLGAVLLVEIGKQKQLDATLVAPSVIFIERTVPFDAKSEFPAINVRYTSGAIDVSSREINQAHYLHTYSIEVMYAAKSSTAANGDQNASVRLQRMMGIIRSILQSPTYNMLGFTPPFAKRAWVNHMEVFESMDFQNDTNQINGRIEYCIELPESGMITATGAPLNEITTTVTLNESDKGYFWDYNDLNA